MHSTTSGALWNIASFIPVLGSDVKSVQTVSATLDTLANDAFTPIAEALKVRASTPSLPKTDPLTSTC